MADPNNDIQAIEITGISHVDDDGLGDHFLSNASVASDSQRLSEQSAVDAGLPASAGTQSFLEQSNSSAVAPGGPSDGTPGDTSNAIVWSNSSSEGITKTTSLGSQIFNNGSASTTSTAPASNDQRIRIIPFTSDQYNSVFGDPTIASNPMSILHRTKGVIFPYTPTITYQHQVDWQQQNMIHTNQDQYYYARSQSVEITIQGDFTAQNVQEAQYCLAVIHWIRSITKMHFGVNDPQAGLPPPVMKLRGYGNYMFNDVPVLIRSGSFDLAPNVDYVEVPVGGGAGGTSKGGNSNGGNSLIGSLTGAVSGTLSNLGGGGAIGNLAGNLAGKFTGSLATTALGFINNATGGLAGSLLSTAGGSNLTTSSNSASSGTAWVPSAFTVIINLIVQQTPRKWKDEFSLDDFINGKLMASGKGWI